MDVPIGKTARRILTIASRYQSETTVSFIDKRKHCKSVTVQLLMCGF